MCGGAVAAAALPLAMAGLSPRVRGSPGKVGAALGDAGSIPACAGEP